MLSLTRRTAGKTHLGRGAIVAMILALVFQAVWVLAVPCLGRADARTSADGADRCCDPLNARTGSSSCEDCVELGAVDALSGIDDTSSAADATAWSVPTEPLPDVLELSRARLNVSARDFPPAIPLNFPILPLRC